MTDPSLKSLLRQLVDDTTLLFRQELRLAQAEVRQSVREAQARLVMMIAGMMLGFCAFLILLEAIVIGLSTAMPSWLASIVVAVVTGAVALVLVNRGEKGLEADELMPKRTIRQAKADKDLVMEKVS
jgi:hypothetical protein